MTLKHVPLPPIVICNLYKDNLVDISFDDIDAVQKNNKLFFLGGNKRHISLLINDADVPFLSNNKLTFLSGILAACTLKLEDVAIVNLNSLPVEDYKSIPEQLEAEIVILFGIESSVLYLPFKIPEFQVQRFGNIIYLFAPKINILQNDVQIKRKLWEALKKLSRYR